MRLPKKPLNANMIFLGKPGTFRWLGDACSDLKTALAGQQAQFAAAKKAATDAQNAIVSLMSSAPPGTDITDPLANLQAVRDDAQQAMTDAQAHIAQIQAQIKTACAQLSGCTSDSQCPTGQECYQGKCVDKCPQGQKRDSSGKCVTALTSSSRSESGWALFGLAAAAVGGIFLASRGQLKELRQRPGNQYRGNRRYP